MISFAVFRNIKNYLRNIYWGFRSIVDSSLVVFPYLFGIGELRKEVTEHYPDPVSSRTEDDLPPRTRGILFNDIDICTGCRDCEKSCPVQSISIDTQDNPNGLKKWVAKFDIDYGRCVFCGLCVEVCEPGSLSHTKQFENAVFEKESLTSQFGRGWVSEEQRQKWERLRSAEEFN